MVSISASQLNEQDRLGGFVRSLPALRDHQAMKKCETALRLMNLHPMWSSPLPRTSDPLGDGGSCDNCCAVRILQDCCVLI